MVSNSDDIVRRDDLEKRIEELTDRNIPLWEYGQLGKEETTDDYDDAREAILELLSDEIAIDLLEEAESDIEVTDGDNTYFIRKQSSTQLDEDEQKELKELSNVFNEMGDADELINDDYFEEYITQLIDDCYEIPTSSKWPYRHLTMDYAAAANEAKADYFSVDWDGVTFWARG